MQSTLSSLTLLIAIGGLQLSQGQNNSTDDGSARYRICGLNYTEAAEKCYSNPGCPTGGKCPVGYSCYQLNSALCPQPTLAPTPSTTAASSTALPYQVCAGSFVEAQDLCFDTTKTCATCNNQTEACFVVEPDQCSSGNTQIIEAPTAPQAQTAPPTVASTIVTPSPSLAPTVKTSSPSVSFAPTKAPTPNRFFCATDWEAVEKTCETAQPCPNGQQDCTEPGMTCFQIQAEKCESPSTSPTDLGAGAKPGAQSNAPTASSSSSMSAPTSSSSSTTASEKVRVCAATPFDAAAKCNVNTKCPDGSAELCANGETCFQLDSCNADTGTGAPTPAVAITFGTLPPALSPTSSGNEPATATPGSVTDSPVSSSPPTGTVGFTWTTPPPSSSIMPNISFVMVGASLAAALIMF